MKASARLSVRELSDSDRYLYQRVLPEQSLLLDMLKLLPWERFAEKLQTYYSPSKEGQPEYSPVILLKVELLCHLFNMGRVRALERAKSDLHWKFFLGLPVDASMPDQSTLCVFRRRLGVDGFKEIFDMLVGIAREKGLISDRLRLKDATHVYANIAIPTSLGLFSQLRNRMLKAVRRFDSVTADIFEANIEQMRERTADEEADVKLTARVELVQDILTWIREQPAPEGSLPENKGKANPWQAMQATGDLAEKLLFDFAHPDAGDKTRSVVDPDARCGKHGEYYDGYLLDVMMDAESELVTALNVLPANGDEAHDASELIKSEEKTHGNDVESLSIDAIGFNGEVLRELTDEEGLNVKVFTPPRDFTVTEGFESSQFELVEGGTRVKCPAGELSGKASRKKDKANSTYFVFSRRKCAACPLLSACHPKFNPKGNAGRRVTKNEYEKEYAHAWGVSRTPQYAKVRAEHPAIERKLNEFVRHHQGRRTKHRGRARVFIQQLSIAMVINIKRMAKILQGKYAQSALEIAN